MAVALTLVWLASIFLLQKDLGKPKQKPKFTEILSKSRAVNRLSAARLFLFGARDIWFVVALPVFLSTELQWDFWQTGGFLASWVIGYGIVQSLAPVIVRNKARSVPGGGAALVWAITLALVTACLALALSTDLPIASVLISGLLVFGIVFAINSSLHSFLIVHYARDEGVSLDVGFYYMSNALGRLIGTLLSGFVYQTGGMAACLWVAALFVFFAAIISIGLPRQENSHE
jgi:predicted MFS family arabinose efflux permease